jgi:glutathione S-transferase
MRLHSYTASANCLKVRCLVSLLAVDVELVEADIFAGATLTDAFSTLNPVREVPVLELEDGQTVTQSSAILQYLAEGTPWAGADRVERAQVSAWMCFEQERVMTGIGGTRFRLLTGRNTAAELAPRLVGAREALDLLDRHLGARDWLVGEHPTIADVSVWAYAHLAAEAGLEPSEWPAFEAWCRRLEALPGWLDDLAPYPENAHPGQGRSIYD